VSELAWEVSLHWVAVAFYMASAFLFGNAVIFGRPGRARWATTAGALGLVPHSAAIVLRWVTVGHGPYMLKFEVLSAYAWVAIVGLLLFVWRRPAWGALALVVLPVAILTLAFGVFSEPRARELPPTLRSVWLVFHIVFADLSAAAFLLSVGTSVLLLLKWDPRPGSWLARLPPREAMDAYTVRFIGFGFVFWTVTIAAGAIWADQSWGRYWGWDPIETWSFVSWVTYGAFLHVRRFFNLAARATAWAAIASFAVFILALIILPFLIPSLHSSYLQ